MRFPRNVFSKVLSEGQARVLRAILHSKHGLTCDEVEVVTGLSHQSASPRVNELVNKGLIVGNGHRTTRHGRSAVVWRARS